ncbi:MAG: monovalent cation/H+ antiporter subunit D family protein [Deltaproteobacteria bacterium]|nr:monovalent cation/H+ antiporter subunit D family protein [Deltaproteobacteria bacterium]MBW2049045.1 monovalent cation/H+ antiporter subunit D family protein [Deltaproteobacteria bacterium]MBW2353176.1 monovalent cation/H+ antiporter subunit D family protein [Deltaproteobacteria bacterium]
MLGETSILIVIIPLISAALTPLVGLAREGLSYLCTITALTLSTLASVHTLFRVLTEGTVHYGLGGWPPPFGIELVVDPLNGMMLVLVSAVGLIVAVYSYRGVEQELTGRMVYFYTLYLLQVTGFLGILITGDLFNLYVFLEIASLAGYALIAVGEDGAPMACFRYIVMGTVGACFYLLGVGYIYISTGSLNMADVHLLMKGLYDSKVIATAIAFILTGLAIKMALFPLHVWLPDAYTKAPSAASALIAPLMTKISIYVMIRILFSVFGISLFVELFPLNRIMVWAGFAAICGGAVMALAQTDFKRMLCYILVAEVGYMIGGLGLANAIAIRGAILHILNDAVMTAGLFTVAGIIMHRMKSHRLADFEGLFQKMPFTMSAFVVCALSMIGVPPTCGFFSKWYLIHGAILARQWPFVAALLGSSLINGILFFRVIEVGYVFQSSTPAHTHAGEGMNRMEEAPLSMLIPTVGIAVAIILIGFYNQAIVKHIIDFALPKL